MHFAYGRGAFRYHRKQRRLGRAVRIEPSFYLALARRPFARERFRGALELEALLVLWHLSNTAGFVRVGPLVSRPGTVSAELLPFCLGSRRIDR